MSKPDAIWLQYGDDDPDDHEYRNEATWCDAPINGSDAEYLRATPVREAAPELLEALKAMYNDFEEVARNSYCNSDEEELKDADVKEADPDGYDAWMRARAAIAKAEDGDRGE